MILEINGRVRSRHPSGDTIIKGLKDLKGELESFAILSKSKMSYIQTSGDPEAGFDMEYQDESIDNHYRCTGPPLDLDAVTNAFTSYLENDSRYLREFHWEKLNINDNDIEPGPAPKFCTFFKVSLKYPGTWISIALLILVIYFVLISGSPR